MRRDEGTRGGTYGLEKTMMMKDRERFKANKEGRTIPRRSSGQDCLCIKIRNLQVCHRMPHQRRVCGNVVVAFKLIKRTPLLHFLRRSITTVLE